MLLSDNFFITFYRLTNCEEPIRRFPCGEADP